MIEQLAIAQKIQSLINNLSETPVTERERILQILSSAFEATKKLPDFSQRVHFLNDMASVCAAVSFTEEGAEMLNQALEDGQKIANEPIRASQLSKLGAISIKLGLIDRGFALLEQALALAPSIEKLEERNFIFCDVACAYGDVGQSDRALEIASLIEDQFTAVIDWVSHNLLF